MNRLTCSAVRGNFTGSDAWFGRVIGSLNGEDVFSYVGGEGFADAREARAAARRHAIATAADRGAVNVHIRTRKSGKE